MLVPEKIQVRLVMFPFLDCLCITLPVSYKLFLFLTFYFFLVYNEI